MTLNRARGFTAIELLVVTIIAGVLMALTTPLLARMLNEADAATTSRLLHSHLYLARSTAIARRQQVVVCAAQGNHCGDNVDWSEGWWVFVDRNRNRRLDDGDERVRFGEALRHKVRIRQGSGRRGRALRFKPGGDAWPSTSFAVCASASGDTARAVVLYYTGRARISSNSPAKNGVSCSWFQ